MRQRFTHRHIQFMAVLVVAAYALGAALSVLLHLLLPDSFLPIGILNYFVHLILLPALVLFPACVLLRRWRLAGLLLPAVLAFFWFYGTYFNLSRANADSGRPTLTVMTFNIDKSADALDPILSIIRDSNADVVAVQELTSETAGIIEQELADRYPHMALHPQRSGSGLGILSRYPISDDEYVMLERAYQRVTLDVERQTVVLYTAHVVQPLGYRFRFSEREWEIMEIVKRAAAEPFPVILAGDFNMTERSETYRKVTAHFADAYREAGWGLGLTYPASPKDRWGLYYPGLPVLRLDYIFSSEDFRVLETHTLPSGGSDHRPVLAQLTY